MARKRRRVKPDVPAAAPARTALRPVIAVCLMLVFLLSWLLGVLPAYRPPQGRPDDGSATWQVLWLLIGMAPEFFLLRIVLGLALATGILYLVLRPRVLPHLPRRAPVMLAAAAAIVGFLVLGPAPFELALILLAAASAGLLVLRLLGLTAAHVSDRLLFALAVGLGVVATQTFVLGLLGWLAPALHAVLLALWIGAAAREWLRLAAPPHARGDLTPRVADKALMLLALVAVVLGLLATRAPVVAYDSLEYHLAAPAHFLRAGRIAFMPHNVYANFPEHVETLYLLGMTLGGRPEAGLPVALGVQWALGVLTALAVGRMVGRAAGARAGLAAGCFVAACPLFVSTVYNAYVTLGVCFYLAMTLYAWLCWLGADRAGEGARRWLALAGLCAGLAAATKYTAVAFVCLPVGLAVIAVLLVRRTPIRRVVGRAALFGGLAALAFSPWMIKNVAYTRNPVYPLAYGVFDGAHWSAEQAAEFSAAHAPGPIALRPAFKQLWRLLTSGPHDPDTGPPEGDFLSILAVLFIPFFVLARPPEESRERAAVPHLPAALALYAAVYWALWYLLTHRIDRFLAPAGIFLCGLSGIAWARVERGPRLRRAVDILAVAVLGFSIFYQGVLASQIGALTVPFGIQSRAAFFKQIGFNYHYDAMQAVNCLPGKVKVLFVGEAQTFYCRRDCVAPVVFNRHPLSPALTLAATDPAAAVRALRDEGYTHLLVNWSELRRLHDSYTFTYKGRRIPGYLPQLDLATLQPLRALLARTRLVHQEIAHDPAGRTWPAVQIFALP